MASLLATLGMLLGILFIVGGITFLILTGFDLFLGMFGLLGIAVGGLLIFLCNKKTGTVSTQKQIGNGQRSQRLPEKDDEKKLNSRIRL